MPPMSMSPEVNAYGQLPSAEQAEEVFKQRFSEMAYNVLFAKFADLAPQVVTFKMLDSDATTGKAVGAFILLFESKPIYIPVIMVDSSLKPMDLFYFKELNIFLPLSKEWLEEVSKMSLNSQGEPSEIPSQVPQDVNIRDLILPPVMPYGRVGLASADDLTKESTDFYVRHMFKEAQRNNSLKVPLRFLEFVENAPTNVLDGIKIAFERHPNFLKKAVAVYGKTAFVSAFQNGYAKNARTVKIAAAPAGTVYVFTGSSDVNQLRRVCGTRAGTVYSDLLKIGAAAVDTRDKTNNTVIKTENVVRLQSPGPKGGFFKLFFLDAPADIYYVAPLHNLRGSSCSHTGYYDGNWAKPCSQQYLVISKDGKVAWKDKDIVGNPIDDRTEISGTRVFKMLENNSGGDTPKTNDYGFFLYNSPKGPQVTEPQTISSVWESDGRTRIQTRWSDPTYIIDEANTRQKIDYANDGKFVFLPKGAMWISLATAKDGENPEYSDEYSNLHRTSIIKDTRVLSRWLNDTLKSTGATEVEVKRASATEWWIGKEGRAYGLADALKKVALEHDLSVKDAAEVLIDAHLNGKCRALKVTTKTAQALLKLAAPAGNAQQDPSQMQQQGAQQQEVAQPQPGQDPAMMGMAPPPPPTISPTDLAIAEAVQTLQHENELKMQQIQSQIDQQQQQLQQQQEQMQSQIAQQQQSLQQESDNTNKLITVLQQIQQRSTMLSQATGGVIPQGAEQSPMAAGQMLAPTPPPEEEPPPMPVMPQEGGMSPDMIAQQINPQLAEQAGDLNDQGVFDTSTLSSLAAAPVLQDLVATYIPNLEKSVDNLGRILLTLWMREAEVKGTLGATTYITLEDKLRNVFKGMGDVVLQINRNAAGNQSQAQQQQQQQMVGDQQ